GGRHRLRLPRSTRAVQLMAPLLEVRNLSVAFDTEDGVVQAVDGVSYSNARISGEVLFEGRDLLNADDAALRDMRGSEIAMIFQDPLSSLHPFYKIGNQLVEAIRAHRDISKAQALDRAVEMLG